MPNTITCQRCDRDYSDNNTKSRRNLSISICTICCDEEAMIDWYKIKGRTPEIPGEVMARETEFLNKLAKGKLKKNV